MLRQFASWHMLWIKRNGLVIEELVEGFDSFIVNDIFLTSVMPRSEVISHITN